MVKDGKLDAIPSSSSLNHPPKTDFTKYDLNSHKVAIVDDISRGQGSEEGRVSPSTHGEFVEVTSKKSQKERHRKEKEEQKRQEEERRRDEGKKKRKQGPPRSGSAGASSEREKQQQSAGGSSKPFSAWMMGVAATPSGSTHITEGELWDTEETLQSHLPVVSAAPGSQLKHQPAPTAHPPQAPPQATPIQEPSLTSPHLWPIEAPKPEVPHTAQLVTSDYSLFGGSSGLLSHAVDSTLPLTSNVAAPASAPLPGQSSAGGVAGGGSGQKDSTTAGVKKGEGWQAQAKSTKINEQELPRDDSEESKGVQKTERGSRGRGASGSSKNIPPRFKSQQEPSGPGRGRGSRSTGRSSGGERRVPGREKGSHVSTEEKKTTAAVTTEQAPDKDKVQ